MDRVTSGQLGARIDRPVDYTREVGHTLEEVKIDSTQALSYEVAPIQSVESRELVSGARNPDALRLGMPEAANPYTLSPMGAQDYLLIRNALTRARDPRARQVVDALQGKLPGVSENAHSHMKASHARVHKMLQQLEAVQSQTEQIKSRVTGMKEG